MGLKEPNWQCRPHCKWLAILVLSKGDFLRGMAFRGLSTLHFQSHGLLQAGFFCFVLTILHIRAIDLGKPSLLVENYRNPVVSSEWWKSHEQYLLRVSWKPFPESSAHQFLSSLLSTFNNCFYSAALSWYMLYRKDWADETVVLNTAPVCLEREEL